MADNITKRQRGKWVKGQSGNPKGKPKGTVTRDALREALAKEMPTILQSVVDAAKGGDMQAAKILLDRVLPPLKPIEARRPIANLDGSLLSSGERVLSGIASGEVGLSEGAALLSAAVSAARMLELQELERRIVAIERDNAGESRP
jgi:hypothetical protein